jgi:hypothetical protein
LSLIISIAGYFASFIFFLWSFFLLLTNQTTVEFYDNFFNKNKNKNKDNPYNIGVKSNIMSVLGENLWFAIFIPNFYKLSGNHCGIDGIIFPLNNGRGMALPELLAADRSV